MDIKKLADKAEELKARNNCCQAVAMALAGETNMTEDELHSIAAGFGSGMGTMDGTCGSLVGAGIIAGLKTGGNGTSKYSRQILERFKEMSGAVTCKDLKGRDTGVVLCPCIQCVRNAVTAYCQTFENY